MRETILLIAIARLESEGNRMAANLLRELLNG